MVSDGRSGLRGPRGWKRLRGPLTRPVSRYATSTYTRRLARNGKSAQSVSLPASRPSSRDSIARPPRGRGGRGVAGSPGDGRRRFPGLGSRGGSDCRGEGPESRLWLSYARLHAGGDRGVNCSDARMRASESGEQSARGTPRAEARRGSRVRRPCGDRLAQVSRLGHAPRRADRNALAPVRSSARRLEGMTAGDTLVACDRETGPRIDAEQLIELASPPATSDAPPSGARTDSQRRSESCGNPSRRASFPPKQYGSMTKSNTLRAELRASSPAKIIMAE